MEANFVNETQCMFCGEPLRLRTESAEDCDGAGTRGYHPCACTIAEQPEILARYSLKDALRLEGRLDAFLRDTANLPEAAIFAAKGAYFPRLVPQTYHQSALWVVRLPEELEQRLEELGKESLMDWTVYGTDLLSAHTHLYWKLKAVNIHFPASRFQGLFPGIGEKPCILFLFISGDTVVLSLLPVAEDYVSALQARAMNTGDNYRPYERFSDEQLAIAVLNAAHQAAHEQPTSVRILPDATIDYELRTFFPAEDSEPL